MPPFNRAVVLMKGFLGDAVMATPLLEGLRAQLPTVVVAPRAVGQLLGPEWADSFIPVDGRGLLPRVRAVRAANADVAFVLNRSFRSALAVLASGVAVRVGHDTERRGMLLTHRVPFDGRTHETEAALDLARALGFDLATTNPTLHVTGEELQRGRALLGQATSVLQPGARHDYKRFRPETLTELVKLLQAAGHSLVLVGGADEREPAAALRAEFPSLPSLVGECTLRETIGLLAASRLAIGADTGVMHIAAAVGCPTVTVFSPSGYGAATRWGHLYPPHQVLQATSEGMQTVSALEIAEAAKAALAPPATAAVRAKP
ncbi:MAG: glycosyltransferase family 9 protein [Fimbriimonadaceae bacterium]